MAPRGSSPQAATLLVARLCLALTPFIVLPVALLALFYNYAALVLIPQNTLRYHVRRSSRFKAQTVVITGISSAAGLRVARAFYQTGHNVVGVEVGNTTLFNPARWSKAVAKFYAIGSGHNDHKFIEGLLRVVVREKANLWVDCLDSQLAQAQAKHVIESKTTCVCLASSVGIAENFRTRHDLLDYAQSLRLPTLETHRVRSRNEIHTVLNDSKGKKYVLSGPNGAITSEERAVLPRRTPSQTYQDISQIMIQKGKPWVLEQYIEGLQKYSTFAIVGHGKLYAFVAYSNAVGGYQVLPSTSGLSQAMKKYVEDFVSRIGRDFSTHLCMEFCVDEKISPSGVVQQTLPVGGHLTAHPVLASFVGRKGSIDLTRAYLSILSTQLNQLESFTGLPYAEQSDNVAVPAETEGGVYQLDQTVFTFVILPWVKLVTWQTGIKEVFRLWLSFVNQTFFWRDSVYEFWDPMPALAAHLMCTQANLRRWFELISD